MSGIYLYTYWAINSCLNVYDLRIPLFQSNKTTIIAKYSKNGWKIINTYTDGLDIYYKNINEIKL